MHPKTPQKFAQLIRKCTAQEPEERPTCQGKQLEITIKNIWYYDINNRNLGRIGRDEKYVSVESKQ
jgi:hypothetical protein